MEYVLFIIGLVVLIKASDIFVDAAIYIAKLLHIPEIIIGATIVSIGTTLPEVMISSMSAIKGHGDIAYGNAIGSIICNTGLIVSISLIFSKTVLSIRAKDIKIPVSFFFITFIVLSLSCVILKRIPRYIGIFFVLVFILYSYLIYKNSIDSKKNIDTIYENNSSASKIFNNVMHLIVSVIFVAIASNIMIDNAVIIARRLNIDEKVIGITCIALGTSLPELTTSITSIMKGHNSLSVGNIIGANLFNILLVIGISSSINPFFVPSSSIYELIVAFIVMMILCTPIFIFKKLYKIQGFLLLIIYMIFIVIQYTIM